MSDRLCPFNATLKQGDFSCPHAGQVVRRGGVEIACKDDHCHGTCTKIHGHIKQVALEAMGHEDDLTSVPHSVLVKIQFGGLLGLQSSLGQDAARVEDIAALVNDAINHFPDMDALPNDLLVKSITGYKMKRRGRKG